MTSFSLSQMSLTATLCTRPAERLGLIFFHRRGLSSKPTMRSRTRRACWALTRSRSMPRGLAMAARMAGLVISWKTMRRVRTGSSPSTSAKCHAIASPSRSSSEASHTIPASPAAAFSFLTSSFLSAGISYIGVKSPSTSTLMPRFLRSRM